MNHRPVFIILAILITLLGSFIVMNAFANFSRFIAYLGFARGEAGTITSWVLAAAVVAAYCWGAAAIPEVRSHMFRLSWLKVMAVIAALCAGIVEEIVFRKWVMDYFAREGFSLGIQILISGLSFGAAHLMWGIRHIAVGINAAIATTVLGLALAVVYWLGGRSLAPCVVAHFLVSALIEPGLLIAATDNKLGNFDANSKP